MAMNRFLILTNRDDSEIVEYDYAWYWVNGYEYVDARFLYLGHSRKVSLNYVELFAYKLFYMNPSCNNQDVFNVVDSICTSKIENGTPLYLKTEDYKQAINYAYNNIPNVKDWKRLVTCKFPKEINIKNRPTPLKRVQLKHNLKGLLQMNEEEAIEYNSMNT